ncbi:MULTISPECIES: SLC13 family permease [Gordonibacter]|uniref:SLC13 family permease n=1 Tax=Gordonibacter TaxID=644652 RepID=UPI001DAA824E|nr:SLC13 family permease [Gordonibacter sp. RACS_AR68]MBS6975655.1 anion permease [Eggerthellaceae bacterium]MDN4469635.1 anion permease [Gordonibacter sp. RACS_AR68]
MLKDKPVGIRALCVAVSVAIVLIALALPLPEGLSSAGKMSLALLVAGIILWVAEPVPFAVTGFAIMISLPVFGILPFSAAEGPTVWVAFISSVIFFVLASFGLSAALLKTKIPTRIVFFLLKLSRGSAKGVILAFMVATAFVSMFVSDLPCSALFAGIATSSILELENAEPGKSRLGRSLMICIPYAACIGGEVLPSGSSMNIMAMGMLKSSMGIEISFLDWMVICLPVAVVLLFVAWISVVAVHKPEPISQKTIDLITETATKKEKLNALDWKVLVILAVTFALWIASNWTGWDLTGIALFALVLFFLPGIDVLSWDEYMKSVSWNVLLLIGSVQALAGGIKEQGAASWFLNASIGKFALGAAFLTGATAVIIPLIRLFIPVGPALIGTTLVPLCLLGDSFGISPVFFTIVVAISASTSLMNGLESASMIVFKYNYWTLIDYFKSGILPTIALMVMHAFVILPIITALGY